MISTWKQSADWLRNNYQDYANIASLCDAMELAAPVADIQPAGGACGHEPHDDCDKVVCDYSPAASAPAQPEAKGEAPPLVDLMRIIHSAGVMAADSSHINVAEAAYRAALAAPVPAVPADKGELPKHFGVFNINGPDGHRIKGYTAEQVHACILADRARQLPRIRHLEHERDLARQAAIAQPSDEFTMAVPSKDHIQKRLAERLKDLGITKVNHFPGTNPNATPDEVAEELLKALDHVASQAAPQPPRKSPNENDTARHHNYGDG